MKRFAATLLALVLVTPGPAIGWGLEGHAVVAEFATMRLTDAANAQVAALLEPGESLASVASWADDVRHKRSETAQWHFVDIPKSATQYDPARDCRPTPHGDCVVAAIERFKTVLANATAARPARAEALKFLVHFVGDIHQPLHCADNHDRGGNDITVAFFKASTNLHAVWDTGIITKAGVTEIDYARHPSMSGSRPRT